MYSSTRWMSGLAAGMILCSLAACSSADTGTSSTASAPTGPKRVTLQTVAPSDAKAAQLRTNLEKAGFKVDGIVQWPAGSYPGWPKNSYEAVVVFTPNCKQSLGIVEDPQLGLDEGDTFGTILTRPPSPKQLEALCS